MRGRSGRPPVPRTRGAPSRTAALRTECSPSPFEQSRKPPCRSRSATPPRAHCTPPSPAWRCASASPRTTSRTSRPPASSPAGSTSRTRSQARSPTAATARRPRRTTARSLEPTRTNGNNVNLDNETLVGVETGLRYQLAAPGAGRQVQRAARSRSGGSLMTIFDTLRHRRLRPDRPPQVAGRRLATTSPTSTPSARTSDAPSRRGTSSPRRSTTATARRRRRWPASSSAAPRAASSTSPTTRWPTPTGYVRYPDIDLGDQMAQLIMAQRGYQANLAVVDRAQDAYQRRPAARAG